MSRKPVIDRIRNKSYLDEDTQCWVFTGADNGRSKEEWSYGHIGRQEKDGKWHTRYVHRIAYEELIGPIPKGMRVLHSCDNSKCWNPEHLFLGTSKENTQDMVKKGRHSHGESRWNARLTEKQVLKIRQMYATGNFTQRELGAIFDQYQSHIGLIVRNQRWKHL